MAQRKAMPDWWERWASAIHAYRAVSPRERSFNKISRAAGFSRDAYLSEMLAKKSIPSVESFIKVCDAIGVSGASILLGFDWTAREEQAMRLLASLPPKGQDLVIQYAERVAELVKTRQPERD